MVIFFLDRAKIILYIIYHSRGQFTLMNTFSHFCLSAEEFSVDR
jgi:hypothetical protein